MTVGQTHQLGKIVGPSDAKVHWNVANDNIATIDQTGKITALAPGSTAVWIEVSKFEVIETATFTLTVEPIEIINRPQNDTMAVGETCIITLKNKPNNVSWDSSNESVATIDKNGKITALKFGTTIISASCENFVTTFTLNVQKTAIIIIPGIMGSELFSGENVSPPSWAPLGTKLWDPSKDIWAGQKILRLACNNFGSSIYNVYCGNENYGALGTYKLLFNKLSKYDSNYYTVEYFPYDWRMSCSKSADDLNNFINRKNYNNIILIAHSMGGIVASCYLAKGETQRKKVNKLITLGTPFLGATELINVYLNGLDMGLLSDLVANQSIKEVMPNISSVYELMPTEKWFDLTSEKPFAYTNNVPGYPDTQHISQTYIDTKNKLYCKLKNYNDYLMTKAENMHDSLFINGIHITNFVDTYYIVGTGIDTKLRLNFDISGETDELISLTNIAYNKSGDGTVPSFSANIANSYPTKTYYALGRYHGGEYKIENNEYIVTEEGLVVSDNVFRLISNIINNKPNENVYGISRSIPSYN